MTDTQAKIAAVDAANQATARIILSDPVSYPGIMQEWARLIAAKAPLPRLADLETREPSALA